MTKAPDNGTNTTQNGIKPPRKRKPATKKELFQFEIDTSPVAQAAMKAFGMTHKRLYPELYVDKVKHGS